MDASPRRILNLVNLFLLLLALCAWSAAALPTIESESPPKPQEITGKLVGGAQPSAAAVAQQPAAIAKVSAGPPAAAKTMQANNNNNAEKLKRGLTNFMNHLNPAAYFVPPKAGKLAQPTAGSQAEPATIVNEGSSAGDVLIKGPNRLVQARQLGGPLRWGRR